MLNGWINGCSMDAQANQINHLYRGSDQMPNISFYNISNVEVIKCETFYDLFSRLTYLIYQYFI